MCVYVYISTRQGSFLSVGRDFLMWKTSFKDFVKTALRLHWMEPARKNKSVGTLFDTQNMPSPHTFTPSSKTSNPTTPRLVNKRRLTSSSPSASASSSHHNEDGVDLVELWTNSLESCGAIVCVCVCVYSDGLVGCEHSRIILTRCFNWNSFNANYPTSCGALSVCVCVCCYPAGV